MRIAYLQGGRRSDVQSVLWGFSKALIAVGHRVAGMVEREDAAVFNDKRDSRLTGVADGTACCLFQDLGPSSQACSLDVAAITGACGLVEASLVPGAELLVISEFGKIEAEGGGFRAAMGKALTLDIPVLTSVNPAFEAEWLAFTGGMAHCLAPQDWALNEWWSARAQPPQAVTGT